MKNVKLEDVCLEDYPDFCDAYISYAEHEDGTPLTDEELEKATEENGELINELAIEEIWGNAL